MAITKRSSRSSTFFLNVLALAAAGSAVSAVVWNNSQSPARTLLNLSYASTGELFRDLNPKFVKAYEMEAGTHLAVEQSDGGSAKQVQEAARGHDADVITLALPSDVNALQRKGLIAANWQSRLPNQSEPYASTIVFVVRKGNPKAVRDWSDLVGADVAVITPDPRTSNTGKLSLLAAWGSIVGRGGSETAALAYLTDLYARIPVLGANARDAAKSFTQDKVGDVQLTSENEALRETAEHAGAYEIVYPPISIRAEHAVAWVDSSVARHHTATFAKAYLEYLFTTPAQEVIAQQGYRPVDPVVLKKYAKRFPTMNLFAVSAVAKDWDDADRKFFGPAGIYDTVRPNLLSQVARR